MATSEGQRRSRWLCAAVAATGIALWPVVGTGVAGAAPAETGDSAASQETTGSEASSQQPERTQDRAEGKAEDAENEVDETEEAEAEEVEAEAEEDAEADAAEAEEEAAEEAAEDEAGAQTRAADVAEPETEVVEPAAETTRGRDYTPADEEPAPTVVAAEAVTDDADDVTETEPTLTAPEQAAAAVMMPTPARTTLHSVVSARPVTVQNVVADVLTWVGLRALVDDLPAPPTPVTGLLESLWLAVRQNQYTWNNQRPTADPTTSEPGPDGLVTGSLNAVDYDDTTLAYRVTTGPQHGTVRIDEFGNFTYTPGAAGHADSFTITVDDTTANPFHVHGLLGLLGLAGPVRVTITVAAGAPITKVPLDRDGVEITADTDGTVKVVTGHFVDRTVTSAEDAAAVLNALAPALGAVNGFATPAAITTATAGVGDTAEHFYRFTETAGGVTVVGSDVILVTDADGVVTGLFNNYLGLAADFDVTPHESVDTDAEVRMIASTAYLGSAAEPAVLETFLARTTFTKQLVVYTFDEVGAPSLAWRAVVQLPDTGDMSPSSVTYFIHADGDTAGAVIVTVSHAQAAMVTGTATDWSGQTRTVTYESTVVWFWRSSSLVDNGRNIITYKTSYPFFGLIGPSLPGAVVKKSWLGWDRAAVSAHANTAVVYDYFLEVLGRQSFDDDGATIRVSIRYNPTSPSAAGYSNAFWDPTIDQFAFGNSGYLQAALDVVGHEFTHAVVSYVVGSSGVELDHGESGALNEAYADILGLLIENKPGADRWLIGEDSAMGAIRNLANPTAISTSYGPYRAHYGSRYTGTGDDGGEHVNSTIFSHAAYKMMTSPATADISNDTWATLFYKSLHRLSPGAKFVDGRRAVLATAEIMKFTVAQRTAIAAAFDSVGITAGAGAAVAA
ncbi:M4 family metallopeptidase [Mycolicibacterium sp.]|uniref:M4 family metallopeptidase n=1 Tax=Mycolicibacterium sp. TaxID=2320850 RepID=UPI003D10D0BE